MNIRLFGSRRWTTQPYCRLKARWAKTVGGGVDSAEEVPCRERSAVLGTVLKKNGDIANIIKLETMSIKKTYSGQKQNEMKKF